MMSPFVRLANFYHAILGEQKLIIIQEAIIHMYLLCTYNTLYRGELLGQALRAYTYHLSWSRRTRTAILSGWSETYGLSNHAPELHLHDTQ